MFLQDEADHKDDGDEEQIDLVSKAERDFFECVDAEMKRRERDHSRKDQDIDDEDEKRDRGKVRFIDLIHINLKNSTLHCIGV